MVHAISECGGIRTSGRCEEGGVRAAFGSSLLRLHTRTVPGNRKEETPPPGKPSLRSAQRSGICSRLCKTEAESMLPAPADVGRSLSLRDPANLNIRDERYLKPQNRFLMPLPAPWMLALPPPYVLKSGNLGYFAYSGPRLLPMPESYRLFLDGPMEPTSLQVLDAWARTETGILSPALEVAHDAATGSGYTVVTRRAINQGHVLLRVPARLAVTAEAAIRAMPRLLTSQLEAHVSMAVWLMRLIDAPPRSLRTYLKALKNEAEVDCTLRWTADEIHELGPWTVAHRRAVQLREWARRQHSALFIERSSALRPAFNASSEAFDWAICAVWSRSFHLRDTRDALWRVMTPGADLLNHAPGGKANAVVIQPEDGFQTEGWQSTLEQEAAATALLPAPPTGETNGTGAAAADNERETAARRVRARIVRARKRRARARARSLQAQLPKSRGTEHAQQRTTPSADSDAPVAAPIDHGHLAEGLSDVALGGGAGVWLWRDHSEETATGGDGHWFGMDANWVQRVCYHSLCIPEPDPDTEAWDAVSAVQADEEGGALVIRATRALEAGEEVFIDYGPRPNAELLTTHGFALADNPHDFLPLYLSPKASDETKAMKTKILAAGNLTAPYHLSRTSLSTDSDLVLVLRILVATPTELQRYADAFRGQALSQRNEYKWRRHLRSHLEPLARQADAESDLQEDRGRLHGLRQGVSRYHNTSRQRVGSSVAIGSLQQLSGRSLRRRQAAILYRIGEKLLIRRAITELDAALDRGFQPAKGTPTAAPSEFRV